MDSLEGFVSDDERAVGPLADRGWDVTYVSWRREGVDWDAYDVVVIRTPWDYQQAPETFLAVLTEIDASSARLENDLSLVRWNLRKTYLRALEAQGIPIVPTRWGRGLAVADLRAILDGARDEVIVKPVVSANADDTFWLGTDAPDDVLADVAVAFEDRPYMVQPFVRRVLDEGEFSLFYFDGAYSHTIRKTPAAGDFRVQEEHGGEIRSVAPESALAVQGRAVMARLPTVPLYARVDLVRMGDGSFALMEVELIEPALYFRTDERSAGRFAEAMDRRVRSGTPGAAPVPA